MISPNQADYSTVISILPMRLQETKPGLIPGVYIIEACAEPLKSCEALQVGRAKFNVYFDESRPALSVPEPSDQIAAAIVRDYKISSSRYEPNVAEPGLFWVRGGYTKEEVLAAKEFKDSLTQMRNLQIGWFKSLVSEADDEWGRYHLRRTISSLQRIACKQLGLEREWDIDQQVTEAATVNRTRCKFCRADIAFDAIVCQFCRGVLDVDKYAKEFKAVGA